MKLQTWYEATAERGAARPGLVGERQADVCIVGGGLAGLCCALEMARAGKHVVLLEADRLAWGASGRNGGFVSSGFAESILAVAKRLGLASAQALYRLSELGTDYVRQQIATSDPTIKSGDGVIVAWRHRDPQAVASYRETMARHFAVALEIRDTAETRALLRTERYFDSLCNPQAFHIHPLRYAFALAQQAEAAGAAIFENTRAVSVEKAGGTFRIGAARGSVTAAHVVHCVSALDRHLHAETGRAVLPVATYVAVTAPLAQHVIRTSAAIADTRRAGDYYRLVDEGRLLWGGRITTRVSQPARLAAMMRRDMVSVFPALGEPRIDYAWPGLMGYALHKMPLIGRSRDGQWYATAFGGHGLNTTAMAGILLARAICERDDEYRRFEPFAPHWAGGPFGRIGVQASYWWMQARDRYDEARR